MAAGTSILTHTGHCKIHLTIMNQPKPLLLVLPWEIRRQIFFYLFHGAQITVDQEPNQPQHKAITYLYRNPAFRNEVLFVCKQIHAEAFDVLAYETSLILLPGLHNPNQAVEGIPLTWRMRIRHILCNARVRSRITHVLRQQHLSPSLFPNLRVYRVAHLVYPDWRDSCHTAEELEPFVQSHLESEFFFQAGTLRLFTRSRTYELTATLWLLRAFVDESVGWEIEFSLDTWTIVSKRKAHFQRNKGINISLWDDPKCRDPRNYTVVEEEA